MVRKYSVILLLGLLVLCTACGADQSQNQLPTVMATPTPEQFATEPPVFSTVDVNQGLQGEPTMDMEAVAATSEAVSAPIQSALAAVPEISTVLSVSATAQDGGIVVHIEAEVTPENDTEATMGRILQVVQAQSSAITEVRVRTWQGTVLQSSWVWANGSWVAE